MFFGLQTFLDLNFLVDLFQNLFSSAFLLCSQLILLLKGTEIGQILVFHHRSARRWIVIWLGFVLCECRVLLFTGEDPHELGLLWILKNSRFLTVSNLNNLWLRRIEDFLLDAWLLGIERLWLNQIYHTDLDFFTFHLHRLLESTLLRYSLWGFGFLVDYDVFLVISFDFFIFPLVLRLCLINTFLFFLSAHVGKLVINFLNSFFLLIRFLVFEPILAGQKLMPFDVSLQIPNFILHDDFNVLILVLPVNQKQFSILLLVVLLTGLVIPAEFDQSLLDELNLSLMLLVSLFIQKILDKLGHVGLDGQLPQSSVAQ